METSEDFTRIIEWCDIIYKLREFAVNCNTTEELSSKLSYFGPEEFLRQVVGEEHFENLCYEGMGEDILYDFHLVQPLIYGLEY